MRARRRAILARALILSAGLAGSGCGLLSGNAPAAATSAGAAAQAIGGLLGTPAPPGATLAPGVAPGPASAAPGPPAPSAVRGAGVLDPLLPDPSGGSRTVTAPGAGPRAAPVDMTGDRAPISAATRPGIIRINDEPLPGQEDGTPTVSAQPAVATPGEEPPPTKTDAVYTEEPPAQPPSWEI